MWIKKNNAFTLLEVLISGTVLAVVLLGVLSGYVSCLNINDISRSTTIASEDARQVIEQMRSFAVTSLTTITSQDWTAWAAANGLNTLDSEQITVTYVENDPAKDADADPLNEDPLEVTVTVTWQDKSRARSLSLSSLVTIR